MQVGQVSKSDEKANQYLGIPLDQGLSLLVHSPTIDVPFRIGQHHLRQSERNLLPCQLRKLPKFEIREREIFLILLFPARQSASMDLMNDNLIAWVFNKHTAKI